MAPVGNLKKNCKLS